MYYIIIAKKNQAEKFFVDPLITKNCVKIDYFYKIVDILQQDDIPDVIPNALFSKLRTFPEVFVSTVFYTIINDKRAYKSIIYIFFFT